MYIFYGHIKCTSRCTFFMITFNVHSNVHFYGHILCKLGDSKSRDNESFLLARGILSFERHYNIVKEPIYV